MKNWYLFIGEKRSNKAIKMNVTWHDGKLSAKHLHSALKSCGINPDIQTFINWFETDPVKMNRVISEHLAYGYKIVGMGKKVQKELDKQSIPHIKIIHPAARGSIRKLSSYEAHVRAQLDFSKNSTI